MTQSASFRSGLLLATMLTAFAIAPRAAFAGNALQGAACTQGTDCLSTYCADGVCCDQACTGDCQACGTTRGLAENGTCANAPEGTAGRNECPNHFVCNSRGADCPTDCIEDGVCATGFYCTAGGSCASQKTNGAACNSSAGADCLASGCRECATGNCVDGACCASCAGTSRLGDACTTDAACASNHCIGGTCCQNACSVTGNASSICSAGTCSAATGYTCELPSGNVACRAESCTDGVMSFSASCDGTGNCGGLQTIACAPYACDATGTTCKDECSSASDCDAMSTCDYASSRCVTVATCSADGSSVISSDGTATSCAPYACLAAACVTSCGNQRECSSGYACVNKSCVLGDGGTSPVVTASSGCSASARRTSFGNDAIALVALVSLVRARRRRTR